MRGTEDTVLLFLFCYQISFQLVIGNHLEACNQNDREGVSFNKAFHADFPRDSGEFLLLFSLVFDAAQLESKVHGLLAPGG